MGLTVFKKKFLWIGQKRDKIFMLKDLKASDLECFIKRKMSNGEFDQEFSNLPKEDIKSSTIGEDPQNVAKNRFRNIIPFDDNLVQLDGDENNYINASFIKGYENVPKVYIATQGPKINTLNDFWRLVWQYNVDVIVMLTQLIEACSNKSEPYWPERDQHEIVFGKISVTLVTEIHFADYDQRNLVVKMLNSNDSLQKSVVHLHFLSWNDYGAPVHCFPLLAFREKVNSFQKHSLGPLLVHCSAGAGRTGTYIAIDYLINKAEAEQKVSIFKCVKDLREQRMNMVQNKNQYIFIYKSVGEAISQPKTGLHCINFIKKFEGFTMHYETGNINHDFMLETENLHKILKRITQSHSWNNSEGLSTLNRHKNRDKDIIACDGHRIHIRGGSNCSGYINAVTIHCHKMSTAYILTQIPLSETISDFWHMIWEYDIKTVLFLENGEKYDSFWPDTNSLYYDGLKICMAMEDRKNAYYSERKFYLIDEEKNYEKEINFKEVILYHLTNLLWHEKSQVPANKIQFQKILKQIVLSNKRVALQCLNGSTRCGLAAAAMLMIDVILSDEVVDPFLACRYVLESRPEAISSKEEYCFLYELAMECIDDSGKYTFVRPQNSFESS